MELEEMKDVWAEMSGRIERQKMLTDKLIIMMTQQQYNNKLNKIKTPETIATLFAFGFALVILVNFHKYDSNFLVFCAILSAATLLVLPVLSLRALYKMSNLNIRSNTFKQIITDYVNAKRNFLLIQKWSIFIGFVQSIVILPVTMKIMGGREIQVEFILWYGPFGVLFFVFFTRWVYRYYVKTTLQLEKLLKQLEE